MKLLTNILNAALVTFTMSASFAGTNILQNESVRGGKVYASFNLRATDGRVLSFFPDSVKDTNNLKLLPPEKNADQSWCVKTNIDAVIGLTDITIRLADAAMKNQPLSLLPNEVALIQKIPRCETYIKTLAALAGMLSLQNDGPRSEDLKSLSLLQAKNGNYLELITESGAKAQMLISSLPKKLKNLSDLKDMQVLAESSGQLLSLQIRFSSDSPDTTPSQTTRTEACSLTYTRQVCDFRGGHCRNEVVTEPGLRYISTQTTFQMSNYTLDLVNAQNQVVYRGVISDGDFNSHDDQTSPCYRQ